MSARISVRYSIRVTDEHPADVDWPTVREETHAKGVSNPEFEDAPVSERTLRHALHLFEEVVSEMKPGQTAALFLNPAANPLSIDPRPVELFTAAQPHAEAA